MLFAIPRYVTLIVLVAYAAAPTMAQAQVIPDGSLPTRVTSRNGRDFAIDNGRQVGPNLFHSFSQFSVPTGGSVVFKPAADVQNIFSRVTGGAVSNIDGLIQAGGSANLFLLNPSGIVFGTGAKLNIGGSFLGTTATAIQFADGAEFSAVNPAPLLTLSVPIGLQLGAAPGGITHRSTTGFQVKEGKSLLLVGGPIELSKGRLQAPIGNLELASIGAGGPVNLVGADRNRLQLDIPAGTPRQNLNLNQGAIVDVRSGVGGRIALYGDNIQLTESSRVRGGVSRTGELGRTSGDVIVNATGNITLDQESRIDNRTEFDSLSASGNIDITAQNLTVLNSSRISSQTRGQGNAGQIRIKLQGDLIMRGYGPDGNSRINTNTEGIDTAIKMGDAGDITIAARSIQMQDGGSISANTFNRGQGGNIAIIATDRVVIQDIDPLGDSSRISNQSAETATGQGGTITITTPILRLSQGGLLRSQAGAGNGGGIVINAQTVELEHGGQISTGAQTQGNAGSITLNVTDTLSLNGRYRSDRPDAIAPDDLYSANGEFLSGIYANAIAGSTGDAGDIIAQVGRLNLSDQAQISVSSQGQGNAGNFQITAGAIDLTQGSRILAEVAQGDQGNLRFDTPFLSIDQGSQITTNATGRSNGGNIRFNAQFILGRGNSDIIANAIAGQGGNIQITTQGIFGLKLRPQLTTENDITASSQFGLNGTVDVNTIGVDPNSGLAVLPVDIVDPSQQIATGCAGQQTGSFVVTGRGGMPDNPRDRVIDHRPWTDIRSMDRSTTIGMVTPNHSKPKLVEAMAWHLNAQNQPELMAIALPSGRSSSRLPLDLITCAR
jgi:filamentous hemagglutinin family protein